MYVDWTSRKSYISKHFRVYDAIYLPRWQRLADEADGLDDNAKEALIDLFERMDAVYEDILRVKPNIHVAFRNSRYNKLVGGTIGSAHIARVIKMPDGTEIGNGRHLVAAVDFDVRIYPEKSIEDNCDIARSLLEPKLELLEMRMEKNPGSSWIHLDSQLVKSERYFVP